ncbi:LysE family translocator [Isoptericola variabilis]|uniref:Lysine exporter protein (LYSE/YGGA) n=1 Tax=Isoptericola variabilis (strain 225) TaxID=743718 RepID=F6FPQ3_ISOV2|nr:LysE family translocator [Isoptericola variabilis]AEG44785.1 Lysine exporter protein (LYSE/YGGA) [Isoptericola variabilis 225]TWH30673.1 threonine/homoserine/homoserine lactone efflux protein [Isoptericola variabilis J7]
MPDMHALVAFAVMSFVLIVVPGPSVLFVIGRSLALGRRGGLMSVLGNELGGLPLVLLVSVGLGAVVAQSAMVFLVVKLLGAGYLVYLGLQAIRHRRVDTAAMAATGRSTVSSWRVLREGFIVGVTNPKTIVFFVAVLPQFVSPENGSVAVQMAILGLVFTAIAFTCDACWALVASAARQWFATSPRRVSTMRATGGGLLVGMGATLALAPAKS